MNNFTIIKDFDCTGRWITIKGVDVKVVTGVNAQISNAKSSVKYWNKNIDFNKILIYIHAATYKPTCHQLLQGMV